MREKLCVMPCHSAQPATKLANAMPTPSITAAPRNIARRRRRPTFCAAKRISSQRSCRDIRLLGEWTLFSEENVFGFVDLHAQVGRPAALRIDELPEPAIGAADILRVGTRGKP